MKVYISADMEGITGVAHWDEVDHNKPPYSYFQEQMSKEVAAACEGANLAGAKEIFVKDAHYSGRNIIFRYYIWINKKGLPRKIAAKKATFR